jgi:hypothetical protein
MVCVRPIDGRPASVRLSGTWVRQAEEFVSLRSAYRSGSTPFASSHRSGPIYWSVSADLGPLDLWNLHRSLPSGKGQLRSVCWISICLNFNWGFGSVLDDSGWLVFTFVRLRRLGEKCVPLDRRSAVDSICFLHTIPCLERAGLEHAADTGFSVT